MLRFTAAIVCATLAFIASSDGFAQSVIYACIASDGTMRIVGDSAMCRKSETSLNWNRQGPQGATGPQGVAGPQGVPGSAGSGGLAWIDANNGAIGPVLAIQGSNAQYAAVLTISNERVPVAIVSAFSYFGAGDGAVWARADFVYTAAGCNGTPVGVTRPSVLPAPGFSPLIAAVYHETFSGRDLLYRWTSLLPPVPIMPDQSYWVEHWDWQGRQCTQFITGLSPFVFYSVVGDPLDLSSLYTPPFRIQ